MTTHDLARRAVALAYGAACHLAFLLGVGAMLLGLHEGLRLGLGPFEGAAAAAANAVLVLQFPLLHSLVLSGPGRRLLGRLAPLGLGRSLSTTTYATFASLQVLATFALWSPSGVVLWEATGALRWGLEVAYALSWLLVMKSMQDAGLAVQMGYLGWTAVARGREPRFGAFPTEGTFRWCRQPIYAAFALTLWTGPVLTPDRLALALVWTAYCVVGPVWKERRYVALYGDAFRAYQARVPFWLPAWPRRAGT